MREDLFNYLTEEVFGWADVEDWQFEDLHWDYYDSSLELDKCHPDFRVSEEQVQMILGLGFSHFWTNHINNTECLYPYKSWKDKSDPGSRILGPGIPYANSCTGFLPDEKRNFKFRNFIEKFNEKPVS